MDFGSLAIYPGEYVDKALRASSSDLVFKLSFSSEEAYLYLLFEHQSSPEPMMAYRLLKYMVRLWESIAKGEKNQKQLPPILPLVLYQGKSPWTASTEFIDLIEKKPGSFLPHVPNFRYLLVDLFRDSSDGIVEDVYGQIALHLMKAVAEGTLLETIYRDVPLIRELLKKENGLELLETLFRYMHQADDSIKLEDIQRAIDQTEIDTTGGKLMGTIAEKLEAQGHEKGILQGMRQGIEKGMQKGMQDVAQKMLKENVDPAFIANMTGLSLSDIQRIESE